jgi:hypothetical protein
MFIDQCALTSSWLREEPNVADPKARKYCAPNEAPESIWTYLGYKHLVPTGRRESYLVWSRSSGSFLTEAQATYLMRSTEAQGARNEETQSVDLSSVPRGRHSRESYATIPLNQKTI